MKATIKRTITEVDGMRFTNNSTIEGPYQVLIKLIEDLVNERKQTIRDYHVLEFFSYNYETREALFIYSGNIRETWKVIYD